MFPPTAQLMLHELDRRLLDEMVFGVGGHGVEGISGARSGVRCSPLSTLALKMPNGCRPTRHFALASLDQIRCPFRS
jgi:hypothetical protein